MKLYERKLRDASFANDSNFGSHANYPLYGWLHFASKEKKSVKIVLIIATLYTLISIWLCRDLIF